MEAISTGPLAAQERIRVLNSSFYLISLLKELVSAATLGVLTPAKRLRKLITPPPSIIL